MSKNQKYRNVDMPLIIAIFAIALIIGGVVLLLTFQNHTETQTKSNGTEGAYLSCDRNYENNSDIFTSKNYTSVKETLRATFFDDSFYDISFTYVGEYADEQAAIGAGANMAAKFDNAVGSNFRSTFNPHSTEDGVKMTFSIYASRSSFNDVGKRLFFITDDLDTENMSLDELRKTYENIGFSCTTKE